MSICIIVLSLSYHFMFYSRHIFINLGQLCNYACVAEAEMELSCTGNDVIHLESGHYGFWRCNGNANCCIPPEDLPPEEWMCIDMVGTLLYYSRQ